MQLATASEQHSAAIAVLGTGRRTQMSQADMHRRALASLQDKEARLRKELHQHQADEGRALAEQRKQTQNADRAPSLASRNSYHGNAERARKKALDANGRAAMVSRRLADNARDQANKVIQLRNAEVAEQRATDREGDQRRRRELSHAREVSRITSPTIRYVQVPRPEPSKLRVLYLTANPGLDLRTESEVRQVQQVLRGAKYRERVEIALRPAAMFQDLMDGLNDVRPHIVHFSGHSGGAAIQLSDGDIANEAGHDVEFGLLVEALAATDLPPKLLVLNSCDSLTGAAVLLPAVPVIVGMSDSVPDVAAIVFSQQFYAAIASGQSVGAALKQGKVKIRAALPDGAASGLPEYISRDDVDVDALVLVQPLD